MRKEKTLAVSMAFVFLISSFTGCASKEVESTEVSDISASTTEESKESVQETSVTVDSAANTEALDLTLTLNSEVTTLDGSLLSYANDMAVYRLCQEGLYAYNSDGELGLGLAESVDISEDGLTYTFTLKDALWSDGTPITAFDFEFSWKRIGDPNVGASYGYMPTTAGIKNAEDIYFNGADSDTMGVTAIDDKTLVVELERPVPYLPSLLSGSYFMPINKEFYESYGDQYGLTMDAVLFSGPFVVSEWLPGGTSVVLEKNPNYYNADKIEVDSITYETIKDNQQLIMAWEMGSADSISISGDLVEAYKDDPGYIAIGSTMVNFIYPNTLVESLNNVNMRMALALCFDKDAICDSILKNGSMPAKYLVALDFAPDENGVTFREAANQMYLESNKDLAAEYYAKACEELGTNSFEYELIYTDNEANKNICQFIQAEVQSTLPGTTITLKPQTSKGKSEIANAHEFDLLLGGWGADYQDATTYLDLFTSTGSYNYGCWHNDEYDTLMGAVSTELANDNQARIDNMIKAEKILMDDAGIIPVYQTASSYLINPEINVPRSSAGGFLWAYTTRK